MKHSNGIELDDLQGLLRFGHGRLTDTCFLLLKLLHVDAAKQWLRNAPVSSAVSVAPAPDTAMQVAFSVAGLRALGLREEVIKGFSDEFIHGMAGDESRSRRLGDTGPSAPGNWAWGGDPDQVPHMLLLLYARQGGIDAWRNSVENGLFTQAFEVLIELPTQDMGQREPFGFKDGISQPEIDWQQQQSTDLHERDVYSNRLALGEVMLGYANEYGEYTHRPLIDPGQDGLATELPDAEDLPSLKDLGRNGSYLVLRQLAQDVTGFWRFIDKTVDGVPEERERLAAAMVGRGRDGSPLVPHSVKPIPGISREHHENHFTYDQDPDGNRCPVGAHIRRSNPRTGDFPPGVTGFFTRLIRILGFGRNHPHEDLVASTRFHRLLRRGRGYGPVLTPEQALKPEALEAERGLQFICLVASISRQFEFVQNAWSMSSTFGGVQRERDPVIGHREPLMSGQNTDQFIRPDPSGPCRITRSLPHFVTVRGGGYFFLPGLRGLKYIASQPGTEGNKPS